MSEIGIFQQLNMAVDWADGGGWWSGLLPGSANFAACVCAMRSGRIFMKHF
jgi:hypothetical protein